jgi:Coenzyme PQQ synthesis protein D (PqqD)
MGLRRAAHVAWRRVGDETVLIHLRDKKIYVLNPSGGFFWHRLDGTHGVTEMLQGVSIDEPMPEEAASGLEAFLERLRAADLVDLVEKEGVPRVSSTTTPGPARRRAEYADYPLPRFVAPALIWQEEVRNFGQSCAFISGASPACDSVPTT